MTSNLITSRIFSFSLFMVSLLCFFFFFFNDPAPTEIYPLPLPAALPIWGFGRGRVAAPRRAAAGREENRRRRDRREPHHHRQPHVPRHARRQGLGPRPDRAEIGRAHV